MILIFDLDDTLYDERTYVDSGLMAVAQYGEARFDWDVRASFRFMQGVLERDGRGRIFDNWLATHGRESEHFVTECLRIYRHHTPTLSLAPEAAALLPRLAAEYPLYLVTDGHKIVQQKKVEALGIAPLFRRVMITHRFGIRHSKPSIHCFDLIRRNEQCVWKDMVHVADNPAKDFVNLKPLGVYTIRVRTGMHSNVMAKPGYDANISIDSLEVLPEALSNQFQDTPV
jgi:putative hydrolase of the HAD superfamily